MKKIFCVICALMIFVSITGCGQKKTEPAQATNTKLEEIDRIVKKNLGDDVKTKVQDGVYYVIMTYDVSQTAIYKSTTVSQMCALARQINSQIEMDCVISIVNSKGGIVFGTLNGVDITAQLMRSGS